MTEKTSYDAGQFCRVDVAAHDMGAQQKWYCDLFGWDAAGRAAPDSRHPYGTFLLRGKVVAGIGQLSGEMKAAGVPSVWNSYVAVKDAEATEEKAKQLGAKITFSTTQVTNAGKLAFIEDPTGAAFAIWEPLDHVGAALVNEPGSFAWNELATTNVEEAKAFYGELFGWVFDAQENPKTKYYVIKNGDAQNGGLMEMTAEWEGVPPHWMVYFAVADVDATAQKVKDTGGRLGVPPTDIPPIGRFSVAIDPKGATFSIITFNS